MAYSSKGTPELKCGEWSKDFGGFEILHPGIFWGRKICLVGSLI